MKYNFIFILVFFGLIVMYATAKLISWLFSLWIG